MDSTSILDLISSSQASKEVTANALFSAMSANALFGIRSISALTVNLYGGKYEKVDGSIEDKANFAVSLTASATNYVYETDGVVTVTTSAPTGWPAPLAGGARALYTFKTLADGIDPSVWPTGGYKDWRAPMRGPGGEDGTNGSVWREGTGAPSSGLGNDGDFYLDGATGDVYVKAAGAYSVAANIKGSDGGAGDFAATIVAATGKTTPVDADLLGLVDSAASNVLKKLTWANVKAAVRTYLLGTVNVFTKNQSVTPVALTDGANIAVDASLSNNFSVTLGGNRTLDNPTNLTSGMVLNFCIDQDGTGSRTLTFGTAYKFPGASKTLSTAANAKDFVSCYYDGTVLRCNLTKAFS